MATNGFRLMLARFLPDGALDPTFGAAGRTVTFTDFNLGSGSPTYARADDDPLDDTINGLTMQPDGKLVAAGTSYGGTSFDFVLRRYVP